MERIISIRGTGHHAGDLYKALEGVFCIPSWGELGDPEKIRGFLSQWEKGDAFIPVVAKDDFRNIILIVTGTSGREIVVWNNHPRYNDTVVEINFPLMNPNMQLGSKIAAGKIINGLPLDWEGDIVSISSRIFFGKRDYLGIDNPEEKILGEETLLKLKERKKGRKNE